MSKMTLFLKLSKNLQIILYRYEKNFSYSGNVLICVGILFSTFSNLGSKIREEDEKRIQPQVIKLNAMKKYFLLLMLSLSIVTITFDSCTRKASNHKHKKGRQQPKKGPMPCPMKDC